MFKNYWKTAIRNLWRNKSYTIINISGLAVGMAACLLLFLVVRFETSFDNFHPKKASIYRVGTESHTQDGVSYHDGIAFPVGPALRIDFPQIKEVASIFQGGGQVTVDNGSTAPKKFNEDNFYYAEPSFFTMFNFAWLSGDAKTALKDPNNIVLTRAISEKYFGDWRAALGKTIKYRNETLFTVTGILENVPPNTDFPLDIVAPYSALQYTNLKRNMNDWVSTFGGSYTFVILPPSLPSATFNVALKAFAKRHKPAEYARDVPIVQPLAEIHYDDRFGNFRGHTFSHSLVNALTLIGVFLLVIACVNFINLATAQAVNRSREVGVRKVLGSRRYQLAIQFLNEAAMITVIALITAVVIAKLTLPFLNQLLDIQLTLNLARNPSLVVLILVIAFGATLLSGIYPAMVLSGFSPIKALKNKVATTGTGGISLRRGLVVLQFAIAHVLIIGTLIVVSQMNYFRNATLGFDKTAIINVDIPGDSLSRSKADWLRSRLLQEPGIERVSLSFASPSSENNWNSDFRYDHSTKNANFEANLKWADTGYFKTFNLQFIAGRPFHASDTVREFVVSEKLLEKLGVRDPQNAIGKEINFWGGRKVGTIVGVVKDFNVFSLQRPMAPVILSTWKDVYQTANIKIRPGAEKEVLSALEKIWTGTFPDYIYEYKFLDKTIENFYKDENRLSLLYKIFAGIAIFISCLGLYGLVSFTTVQRTKEIGIRKVLGATSRHIVYMLSREFTLLILLAFIIAGPIAYYIMYHWLEQYTYRIRLGVPLFVLAIAGSIAIAWITVGYRAIHAALANPVNSLRSE